MSIFQVKLLARDELLDIKDLKNLASLAARNVFGEVQEGPRDKTLVGHRWVFVTKRNSNRDVIRFKARLVAQGFSQKFGTDYEATYSPVMDASSFRFLTAFATNMTLSLLISMEF